MIHELPKVEFRKSFDDPSPAWGIDNEGNIFIRCGKCGKCINLSSHHSVDFSGYVRPSVWHIEPSCGWHVWVKLNDWKPK